MKQTSEFWRGFRDGVPVAIAASVFALVYGTVAQEKGLTLFEAGLLSATVYAGASQFMALQFWDTPLPALTIILIVLAVNFRHVFYGASLSRKLGKFSTPQKLFGFIFLVDPQFALSEKRHEDGVGKPDDPGLNPAYFFGIAICLYPMWLAFSLIGYLFGNLIENPDVFGLDFVLPVYFLMLLMAFKQRSNWLAVVTISTIVGAGVFLLVGSPWHISAGALAGILAGAVLGPPHDMAKEKPEDAREEAG